MSWSGECPAGPAETDVVLLAHGEGGRLSRRLVQQRIATRLANPHLAPLADAAHLPPLVGAPVFTTDSFVVTPLFFPGGDIGSLAVYGTVNDLAVAGARPLWLSLSLILEEGLPFPTLDRVLESVAAAARRVGVQVVTGDTKVVPRGAADQLFINTAGIGELLQPAVPGPAALVAGDALLVSGPIGQHGLAILAAREAFAFQTPPRSDCGPLVDCVQRLRRAGIVSRALRDATRGGVAAVLHEWAAACRLTMEIEEQRLPVTDEVRGACELFGLDPLFAACEGAMVVAVEGAAAERALVALRECEPSAAIIGRVTAATSAPVVVRRLLGRLQALDEPAGAPLPRIC